jgi:hypothetical protein
MIEGLDWAEDAKERFDVIRKNFPQLEILLDKLRNGHREYNKNIAGKPWHIRPVDLLEKLARYALRILEIPVKREFYSSDFNTDGLKGQDRIISLCKQVGATEYINSPGGKGLYDEEFFLKEGIKLTFLPEYRGGCDSIVDRLYTGEPKDIRKEIYDNL